MNKSSNMELLTPDVLQNWMAQEQDALLGVMDYIAGTNILRYSRSGAGRAYLTNNEGIFLQNGPNAELDNVQDFGVLMPVFQRHRVEHSRGRAWELSLHLLQDPNFDVRTERDRKSAINTTLSHLGHQLAQTSDGGQVIVPFYDSRLEGVVERVFDITTGMQGLDMQAIHV